MSSSAQKNPFGNSMETRPVKAQERSNFAHTCNLLSQYVKERGGSLKDLNIAGIAAAKKSGVLAKKEESKSETCTTTLNLLNSIENSRQPLSQQGKSLDHFVSSAPMTTNSGHSEQCFDTREATSSMEAAAVEPERPQMTIFYAGRVMVFDDFSAEKAQEIMKLASSGAASPNDHVCGSWNLQPENEAVGGGDAAVASCSKEMSINPTAQESMKLKQPKAVANSSDLPIARRSSLHRFLAKRKDRAGARAPYQLHNNNDNNNDRPESSSKNDQQLELKL